MIWVLSSIAFFYFLSHGWHHRVMNNIISGSLAQERGKGNGVEVLVNILDRSLFGDRDDICLFPS